jgi:hypothetical protein
MNICFHQYFVLYHVCIKLSLFELCTHFVHFRVEFCESNRMKVEETIDTEFEMTLPDWNKFFDLNNDRKIAPIDKDKVDVYLKQFEKALDQTATNLYRDRYLCFLRHCQTEEFEFVKSACRAEMRKSVTYAVDISLSKDGHVHETQCECAAGMGPNAHCKHVCAVLHACTVFRRLGTVHVEQTCTEKLQTFHHTKRYLGSPLHSRSINMPGAGEVSNVDFDPRPAEYRNTKWYPSYFQNICLNYKGISTMPIFQTVAPANTLAAAHDHDYLQETPESNFLTAIGISDISKNERDSIEQQTRGQSKNERWFEEREIRLQSSNFGRICKATDRTDFGKLACSYLKTTKIRSDAILHGQKYEKAAVQKYEKDRGVQVTDCGIFVSRTKPYIGASPDGVVNGELLCEVKCPYTAKDKEISHLTVPYLKPHGDTYTLSSNHDYFYQIQGQLFCTEKSVCDLNVYTLKDIKYIRIKRDDQFISDMLAKLELFYTNHFEQALLEKRFYRTS